MTKEEKRLLIIDLCDRLPYGVRVKVFDKGILSVGNNEKGVLDGKETMGNDYFVIKCHKDSWLISCEDFKPYLRPMSSMTEDEENEWSGLNIGPLLEAATEPHTKIEGLILRVKSQYEPIDWLNAHHFDYRGLIEKSLALEAPEGMYN